MMVTMKELESRMYSYVKNLFVIKNLYNSPWRRYRNPLKFLRQHL